MKIQIYNVFSVIINVILVNFLVIIAYLVQILQETYWLIVNVILDTMKLVINNVVCANIPVQVATVLLQIV